MISKIILAVVEEPVAKDVQKLVLQKMSKRMGSIALTGTANILKPRFKKLMKINLRQNKNIESV